MPTKAGIIYAMNWLTVKDNGVENAMLVKIYDNAFQIDVADTEQTFGIEATGDPLHISTDRGENKFIPPIRAKKATIKFLNSDAINYSTFSTGEDNRFLVEIYVDSSIIFKGWLQQGDIFEPFITQKDQEVTLTAVCGLTFLKGQPLTDFDGNIPTGKHTIAEYIAWCLRKTGHFFNFNVINNLREKDNPDIWTSQATFVNSGSKINVPANTGKFYKVGNTINVSGSASNNGNKVIVSVTNFTTFYSIVVSGSVTDELSGPTITFEDLTDGGSIYKVCSLDAKTAEDKIGTTIDCYTVLERIFGFDCFVEQYKGDWWIRRVREFRQDFDNKRYLFDNVGNLVSSSSTIQERAIGLKPIDGTPFAATPDAIAFFSKAQTQRTNLRPNKSVKLTYKYEFPLEPICNIDYSRGNFISDLPDEIIEDITYNVKKYVLDCWTLKRGAGSSATTPNCETYIKKYFAIYEQKRFIIITLPSAQGNPKNYIESSAVEMNINDKFTFSFDWATEFDVTGGGPLNEPVASVWLEGDDGSFWKLLQDGSVVGGPAAPFWFTTNSADDYGLNSVWIYQVDFANPTDAWTNIQIQAPSLPVSGKIRFRLHSSGAFAASSVDDFNVKISNIQLDYFPLIAGTNVKFSGQSFISTRNGVYKSKIDDQVYISNSPAKNFKGALLKKNNLGIYILCDLFYEGQEYLTGNEGQNHLLAYGDLQVRAVHNQLRNADELYQLTAQGLNGYNNMDLVHRVYNRDIEPATNKRAFMILWIDQNWRNSEWSGAMVQNFDTDIGFIQDTVEFKYES